MGPEVLLVVSAVVSYMAVNEDTHRQVTHIEFSNIVGLRHSCQPSFEPFEYSISATYGHHIQFIISRSLLVIPAILYITLARYFASRVSANLSPKNKFDVGSLSSPSLSHLCELSAKDCICSAVVPRNAVAHFIALHPACVLPARLS